jgi:hypothetical protein
MTRCELTHSPLIYPTLMIHSMETHRQEREQRDATRKAAWDSAARNDGATRSLQNMSAGQKKSTLADRAKYQFEADSEDDEMENEIDGNLGTYIYVSEV